jgi:hypothetical protein
MRLLNIAAPVAVAGVLVLAPAQAQQPPAPGQHELNQITPQNKPMMDYDKMMADMNAADARLEELTDRMKTAQGDEKIRAMQDVVSELATNQLAMHNMARGMIHKMMPHK